MSYWEAFKTLIKWGPIAFDIMRAILKAIGELKNPKEQAIAKNELHMAMKEAQLTRNLKPIEAVKDRCGIRCRIEKRKLQ